MTSFTHSRLGLTWLFRPFLLDVFNLVDQVVGHFDQLFPFTLVRHRVCLAAIQQIQVGHRIVVLRSQFDRVPQSVNSFISDWAVLSRVLFAALSREWVSV